MKRTCDVYLYESASECLRGVALMMMLLPSHIRSNERTKMDDMAWPEHEKLWNFTDWKIYIFFETSFLGSQNKRCGRSPLPWKRCRNVWYVARSPTLSCPFPNEIQSCVTNTFKTAHHIYNIESEYLMMTAKVYVYLITYIYISLHLIAIWSRLWWLDCIFFSTQGHLLEDEPFLVGIGLGPSAFATWSGSIAARPAARHGDIPSMELTYPTLGEGNSSTSKVCSEWVICDEIPWG